MNDYSYLKLKKKRHKGKVKYSFCRDDIKKVSQNSMNVELKLGISCLRE